MSVTVLSSEWFASWFEGNERTRRLLERSQRQIELSLALLAEKLPPTRPTAENRRGTILIVEDDEAFGYAVAHYLKSNGYGAIVASGSLAALRELDNESIDVVVADVNLHPNEPHGLALGRMIVTKKPRMPVLFVTGRPDLIELDGHPPGDVLYKPIELDVLARKIDGLMART
jgi:DNA-binding NtrC family response regulator